MIFHAEANRLLLSGAFGGVFCAARDQSDLPPLIPGCCFLVPEPGICLPDRERVDEIGGQIVQKK